MYRHHFRVKPGDKLGWLRNMFFGLSQQLLHQDPFCVLRPDHEWKLIAYSYYAKYQVPGNNTAFRHIDANIRDLADLNRSSGFIQGTLFAGSGGQSQLYHSHAWDAQASPGMV